MAKNKTFSILCRNGQLWFISTDPLCYLTFGKYRYGPRKPITLGKGSGHVLFCLCIGIGWVINCSPTVLPLSLKIWNAGYESSMRNMFDKGSSKQIVLKMMQQGKTTPLFYSWTIPLEVTRTELLAFAWTGLTTKLGLRVVALPGARDSAPSPTRFGAGWPKRPTGPGPIDSCAVRRAFRALLSLIPHTCWKHY